jgi:hypothetical protein
MAGRSAALGSQATEGVLMGDEIPKLVCRSDILALIPEPLAREYCVFPLADSGEAITLAVEAPLLDEFCEFLRCMTKREIREVIYPIEAIRKALYDHYGEEIEPELSLYYYRESARTLHDDSIEMYISGYSCNQGWNTHLSGWNIILADDPDHGLWRWLISQGGRFGKIIGPNDLEEIRREFRRDARMF